MDQPKLERLLRVMMLLTSNSNKTIENIAQQLNISSRSVYRYIDTFREAGFVIKKNGDSVHLDKASPYFKEISELIHFTDEEAYILKSAIESIDENNIIKQNLKKKLYTVYNYKILAETIVNNQNSKNVANLVNAIESKKKVILRNYSSGNSSDIRDRYVEAFAFTTNYIQIWCYDPEFGDHKLFNVSRIGIVEVLDEPWDFESRHEMGFIDVFRFHSDSNYPVKLRLSLRAVNLLTEEYPLARQHLVNLAENEWLFEADVCSFDGVGRFVMGLLEEDVKVEGSQDFIDYLKNKVEKIQNIFSLT